MTAIGRALDALSESFAFLGGLILMIIMLHVSLDVLLRFFLNMPLVGTIEISSYYYMIALVFLPLAAVERHNGHIAVELVSQHLSESAQRIMIGLVSIFCAFYYAILTWRTGLEAIEKAHVGETYSGSMQLAIWPPRFLLPIGCGLITIVLLWKAARLLSGDVEPLRKSRDENFAD